MQNHRNWIGTRSAGATQSTALLNAQAERPSRGTTSSRTASLFSNNPFGFYCAKSGHRQKIGARATQAELNPRAAAGGGHGGGLGSGSRARARAGAGRQRRRCVGRAAGAVCSPIRAHRESTLLEMSDGGAWAGGRGGRSGRTQRQWGRWVSQAPVRRGAAAAMAASCASGVAGL